MARWLLLLIIVAVLSRGHAKPSPLEQFLTSGFDKDSNDENQDKEVTEKVTEDQLMEFMRRTGLMGTADNNQQQAALQPLNPQAAIYYVPQASQLTNYVAPKRQLEALQQQQVQQKQPTPSSSTTDNQVSGNQNYIISIPQQSDASKTLKKVNRQGLFPHDGGLYDNGYTTDQEARYIDTGDSYSNHHAGEYAVAGHRYAPEPVYHKPPPEYHPPSVAIKIDPLSILRLLLQGIPKPLLNLNGRMFFGVELGKKAGISKAVGGGGYAQPHHGYGHQGGGTVISLG